MIGFLNAVVGVRTPEGFREVEIFEGVGTIIQRSVGKLLMRADAAIVLAEKVNRDDD